MKDMSIKKHVYEWLANFYNTNSENIYDMLDCQVATLYLLIWPVMEQHLFSGFMKQGKINETAIKYAPYYYELDIEEDVSYFYKRYQDNRLYKNLKYNNNSKDIDSILMKSYKELTETEKLQLMIFIVYRYRNNIFHGSKGIESWIRYSLQIEKCIAFMMKIVDCHNNHFQNEME